MNKQEKIRQEQDKKETQRYKSPQIIYESQISTRAESSPGNPSGVNDIDPADLFGE